MKMIRCDICDADINDILDLRELLPEYATDEIRHCCRDCNRELDSQLLKIEKTLLAPKLGLFRRFMLNFRKYKRCGTTDRKWEGDAS